MEKRVIFKSWWLGVLLVVPQLLLVFTFFYWPTGAAFVWAFTFERPWGGGVDWAGFENFRQIFAQATYWEAVLRNLVFVIATTVLCIGIGGMLALLCDRQLKGSALYQSTFTWPYAVVAPAAALAFRFIFSPEAGIFSGLVHAYPGIWNPAQNGVHAMIMIIVCFSWKYVAYCFIFFLAGLQSIPRTLVEAAAMDGSGPLRRMRDIQIPLLTPTLFFLVVIVIAESFQDSVGIIDIMTDGGPARSTELLVYKNYFDGFRGLDYSGAAAQSIVMIVLMVAVAFMQFRYIERKVHYEG
jgi:sn-glycerol 3-phosphate transport system permease protein